MAKIRETAKHFELLLPLEISSKKPDRYIIRVANQNLKRNTAASLRRDHLDPCHVKRFS